MRRACCIFTILLFLCSCSRVEISGSIDAGPDIFPDYKEVTVPENISPLNFSYLGEEKAVLLVGDEQIRARKGLFKIRPSVWKSLMTKDSTEMTVAVCRDGKWMSLRPFRIFISHDKIDPYIAYRLIPPGYQGWKTMGIFQRNLESYEQKAIVRNSQTGENCVNCHSFANRDPSNMVFHSRATFGGTMLFSDGILEKLDTKTDSTISALVYPYWHPTGKFIAFSVNNTKQVFLSNDPNRVEVFDAASDVVVYDVKNHCVTASPLTKSPARFETFPTFSPDGRWLYFCSASAVKNLPERYKNVRYGLYRVAFDVYNSVSMKEALLDRKEWGHILESGIGAYLINQSFVHRFEVYYWREKNFEVDFVLKKGKSVVAVEVKSNAEKNTEGLSRFKNMYNPTHAILIGNAGISTEEFLNMDIDKLF